MIKMIKTARLRVAALWLSDVLCITTAWVASVVGYWLLGFGDYEPVTYLSVWPAILLFTGINAFGRLYHGRFFYPGFPLSPVEEFRRLVLSALATHLAVMAFFGFGHRVTDLSRFVLIVSGLLSAVTAQMFRDAMRGILRRLDIGWIPALLVGDGAGSEQLERTLADIPHFGFRIVRRYRADELDAAALFAEKEGVRHLFWCPKSGLGLPERMPEELRQFAFVEYISPVGAFPSAETRVVQVGGRVGLEMANQRNMKLLSLEKSVVDRLLSLIILVLALPIFFVVPVLIKLTSRGPVFYRANRLGKKGRPIRVWKFRSMYADADARLQSLLDADPALKAEFEKDFKLKNDPRVTPLGRILRKTSIDELPQLFNVFSHEMALIGPRPIVEKEVAYYGEAYDIFSSVKPGITGLWQASGRSDCDYEERVALDVHYVLNWSPWLDVWIVMRTVAAVLKMRGSY